MITMYDDDDGDGGDDGDDDDDDDVVFEYNDVRFTYI